MSSLVFIVFMLLFAGVAFLVMDSRRGYLRTASAQLLLKPYGGTVLRWVRIVRLTLGCFAGILFVVVTAIKISTWISSDIGRYAKSLMWFHLLVLAVTFSCAAFAQGKRLPTDRKTYLRGLPKWAKIVFGVLFCYMLALFVLEGVRSGGSYSITERDGHHYFKTKGNERELSQEEYSQFELRTLRGFSSFWMLFSGVAGVYLLVVRDEATA